MFRLTPIVSILLAFAACKREDSQAETKTPAGAQPPGQAQVQAPLTYDAVSREDFNRIAAELALPLFWSEDQDNDHTLDPAELAVTWGPLETPWDEWLSNDVFTPRFDDVYRAIAKVKEKGHTFEGLAEGEKKRRELVLKELEQGRPTLLAWRFDQMDEESRQIVRHVLVATKHVERIYLQQRGAHELASKLAEGDAASRTLFHRNQGPWCAAPATEGDADCSAIADKPPKISGLYPASIQSDKTFCEQLAKRPDAADLLGHFTVVRHGSGGAFEAVPYNVAFREDMEAASKALAAAAGAITSESEAAFKAYLLAASQAFLDNNWVPADEAWSRMSVDNSKWYLRIGPDEVYHEPCNTKAGFHVSFGRINQDSLEWQKKLDPLKTDLEQVAAKLSGAPYKARKVSFHLPDFVDIVVNAGDSRSAHGATIGQSLPNWGPVAAEGRGRTVAMTNLYTDKDSKATFKKQSESLLCPTSMAYFSDEDRAGVMSTVLHEAAHNLGPSHEYKVKGKVDDEVFGGPLASMLEELKAQTGALYYTDWLVDRGVITADEATRAHVRDILWAFGHISRGMYSGDGRPKPYSQLAAIQLGFLIKEGALRWDDAMDAANGSDRGCLDVAPEKLRPAIEKLGKEAFGIKSRGDKARAEALKAELVDSEGRQKELLQLIAERWLRSPKASFVYSIRL